MCLNEFFFRELFSLWLLILFFYSLVLEGIGGWRENCDASYFSFSQGTS